MRVDSLRGVRGERRECGRICKRESESERRERALKRKNE